MISFGVGVFPVPIAHIGSYAITTWFSSTTSESAVMIWFLRKSLVLPSLKHSSDSPIQTTGWMLLLRAALIFVLIRSLPSLNKTLLSEWPNKEKIQPASDAIDADI